MIILIGAVYRVANVDFLATIDKIDSSTQDVTLRFVNVINWISIGGKPGKQLVSGKINCPDLENNKVELVANAIGDYYAAGTLTENQQ